MAENRRVRPRKWTHRRRNRPSEMQPERPEPDNVLYAGCREFVEEHNAMALDDSHDRTVLTRDLYLFVRDLLSLSLRKRRSLFDEVREGFDALDEMRRRELEEDDPEHFEK